MVVLQSLQEDGRFKLRAPVADPKSSAAQSLAGEGVDVVLGDLSDDGVVRQAVAGSYGVFAVTST